MKKMFLLLLASAAIVSCGSDDGDSTKRPSAVTLQGGSESYAFNMTYDNKGRVGSLISNYNGAHTFTFSYNESGKVSNVVATGSLTGTTSFTYGSDGKLSSVSQNGQATPLTWIDATTVSVGNVGTIKLDEKGDIVLLGSASLTRDIKKGPFADVKGVDNLSMYFIEATTVYFAGKRPIKSFIDSNNSVVFTNTFDHAYLSNATFPVNNTTYVMNVTY